MNILIIIVVATILIAGIGAVVYVLIHRIKHKKEVLDNSQYNTIPSFGGDADGTVQQNQVQPVGSTLGQSANQESAGTANANAANNIVMNDITQGSSVQPAQQDNIAQETPITPQPPVASANDTPQPEINRNFPGNSPESETLDNEVVSSEHANTAAEIPKPPVNTLDLKQGTSDSASDNILADTETTDTVEALAENTEEIMIDSNIDDSKVPVTSNEDVSTLNKPVEPLQPTQSIPSVEEPSQSIETSTESKTDNSVAASVTEQPAPDLAPPVPEAPTAPNAPNPVVTDTSVPAPETPVQSALESPATPSAPADTPATSQTPVQSNPEVPVSPANDETPKSEDKGDDQDGANSQEMHI